jgi:hypothetical protein
LSAALAPQAWAGEARERTLALAGAIEHADWEAAATQATALAALLAAPPPAAGDLLTAVYEEARGVLELAAARAATARDATREELRQLVRGRKALAAYG